MKKLLILVLTLVLAISMIPTTSVSAATKNQKKTYNKIVKYLKSYGDKHGNSYSIKSNDFEIITSKKGTSIQFHYFDDIAVNAVIKKKTMTKVKFTVYYVGGSGSEFAVLKSSKTMKTKKYNYRNFNYKYKLGDCYGIDKATAQYYSNEFVNAFMKGVNGTLKSEIGVNLKQLGFKKCK